MMSLMHPETEERPEAADGVASHWVGADIIEKACRGVFDIMPDAGTPCPENGVLITDEMIDAAELYAGDVTTIMRRTGNFVPHIEKRVNLPMLHETMFGTPDAWLFDRTTGHLYIWDYKFGRVVVEAFECWQLLCYAAGIFPLLGVDDEYITAHFRIVQPRAFHRDGVVREWVVNAVKLRGYFNILESKALESLRPDEPFTSGPHCRYCSGRHNCDAAIQSGVLLYEITAQSLPDEMSADALGLQLAIVRRAIEQMKYIESGMSAQVEGLIRGGTFVPGWGLESVTGRKKWNQPVPEIIALGDSLGVDVRKDGVITPSQAVKLGIDDSVINAYSGNTNTGLKLTPDNGNKARRLFK